jgi:hypothetical protein
MRGLQHGYIAFVISLYIIIPNDHVLVKYISVYIFVQVSYLATDILFPEWKIWTQFLYECTEGLRPDGLAESHPIEVICMAIFFSWV